MATLAPTMAAASFGIHGSRGQRTRGRTLGGGKRAEAHHELDGEVSKLGEALAAAQLTEEAHGSGEVLATIPCARARIDARFLA